MSTAAPSPQLLQRVAEKKQELEHLLVLRQLANHLETHFDGLSEKFDGLTQGNQGTYSTNIGFRDDMGCSYEQR